MDLIYCGFGLLWVLVYRSRVLGLESLDLGFCCLDLKFWYLYLGFLDWDLRFVGFDLIFMSLELRFSYSSLSLSRVEESCAINFRSDKNIKTKEPTSNGYHRSR